MAPSGKRVGGGMRQTQRIVIIIFLAISALGCSGLISLVVPSTPNYPLSKDIPPWSRLETGGLSSSSAHVGEVLAMREVAQAPTQVVSAGTDGNVLVWSLQNGTGHLVKQVGGPMQLAAFGERRMLLAWSSGPTVHVTCLAPGCTWSWELSKLKTRLSSLAFHEDDSAVIIGGADGRVYRWRFIAEPSAQTLKERDRTLERYVAHQTAVNLVRSLPTGRAFFSADWDGVLYGWLAYTADDQEGSYDRNLFGGRFFGNIGSYLQAARLPDRGITSLAISTDGSRLTLGTDDGFVEVWEIRGLLMIARKQSHSGRVVAVTLNNNGSRVVSVGRDGEINIQDVVADPAFSISSTATQSQLIPVSKEAMKSARGALFLSSGNVLISTDSGQLGELALSGKVAPPLPTPTPTTLRHSQGHDSDY